MSTLSELKHLRLSITNQIREMATSVTDEDQKVMLLQELNTRLDEIEAQIEEIEGEEQAAKDAKKQAKKDG